MTNSFYYWTNKNQLFVDDFWMDFVLSFDNSTFSFFSELDPFFMFVMSSFSSVYFSLSSPSVLSFFDTFFLDSVFLTPKLLIKSLYMDIFLNLNLYSYFSFLLFSESINSFIVFSFLNPEWTLFFLDFKETCTSYNVFYLNYVYDSFFFSVSNTHLFSINLFFYFILWCFLISIVLIIPTSTLLSKNTSFFFTRSILTLFNVSSENRMQFDWTLLFLLFILLIWIPLLMTYDDTNVEVVEYFHFSVMFIFLIAVIFLMFRYSTHYFSFLEASVSDGFSSSYIAKQFVRDVSNTFALFLRFFLLVFRLNIYDGLDDFLDSYFIFFIDFEEDSYIDESLLFSQDVFFTSDNAEDSVFYKKFEFDSILDLFSRYYILLGKFLYFWIFILEEAFRVLLAFYISYLIIFEVHAVNASYSEEKSSL